jgi:excisionase family DNA binding protein
MAKDKDKPRKMLAVETIAEEADVTHWTVRTWCREGRLPYMKIGRRILVDEEDWKALLMESRRPAKRPA